VYSVWRPDHLFGQDAPGECKLHGAVREYNLIADWYAAERVGTADGSGVPEVRALASSMHPGGRVLDIGCGNGVPLTRALSASGHRVVGLDSASEMLRRFHGNCPDAAAVMGTVQACPFASATFDGAVAWGVMFHLTQAEQLRAVASVSRVLKIGAPLLFTAGDLDDNSGNHVGKMNGVEFRYYSFSFDDYRRVLSDHGLAFANFHHDAGENGYYLAHKVR
jgi:SAM-dependent methyltransferase